ncbi:MAG TPA: hypothetical protein VNQ77_17305 [Frankiaceae bacterium]|nr:hypothetical protein [Frankiaceae bacterium]
MTYPEGDRPSGWRRLWRSKGGYSGAFPISVLGPPPKTPSGTSAVSRPEQPEKKAS